jgi:hypothetical protein
MRRARGMKKSGALRLDDGRSVDGKSASWARSVLLTQRVRSVEMHYGRY